MVDALFETDSGGGEIDCGFGVVSIVSDAETPHILKIDLLDANKVVVPAGTSIMQWHIDQDINDDVVEVRLYPDQNCIDEDEPIICKVFVNELFLQSTVSRDRLKEVESKYKELEEDHKELEDAYNDLYNRPPELGGPGYIEAKEDFNSKV